MSSLTSSPTFVTEYVSRKLSSRPPCTLLNNVMRVGRSDKSLEKNLDKRCLSFSVLDFPRELHKRSDKISRYSVVDSSNGLFLCKLEVLSAEDLEVKNYRFYICNPVIDRWIELPKPIFRNHYRGDFGFTELSEPISPPSNHYRGSFGFTTQLEGVSTITSYKIVIFSYIERGFKVIVEIFSSESGTWTSHDVGINGVDMFLLNLQRSVGVANRFGILHWFNQTCHNVLAYKPMYRDSCRLISLPLNYDKRVTDKDRSYYKDIDAFDANLRYLEIFREPGQGFYLSIWILTDYENGGIWHLDHKLSLRDQRFYNLSMPNRCKLGQFDANTIYIWLLSSFELLMYDIRTKNITLVDKQAFFGRIFGEWCLPLPLPIWPPTLKLVEEN